MIEAIGRVGEDMLGVEEHPNLTLSNPDIPAIWNAKAPRRWTKYGDRNDGDQAKNVIRRFLDSDYRTYKVEVNPATTAPEPTNSRSGSTTSAAWTRTTTPTTSGPAARRATPRAPTCRLESDGRQVLLTGTDWGNNNVTRPEMHHVSATTGTPTG